MANANVVVNTLNPSINLAALNVPAAVVVSDTTPPVGGPTSDLKSLESARIHWETTELAASNNRLYSILQQAYQFYLVMKQDADKEVRKAKQAALDAFISERGYTNSFGATTHDMTRVIKCVFGVNRRRVSAYSIALREALRQEVPATHLVTFLQDNGGVEQIRMGGTKPLSITKRAQLVQSQVSQATLGTIKLDAALVKANADWVDKQVVLVATYQPTGELEVNAVIRHDGAVKTALAACYTLAKAREREEQAELKKAELEAQAQLKAERKAEDKLSKQKAKTAKQIAYEQHLASAKAAFEAQYEAQAQFA